MLNCRWFWMMKKAGEIDQKEIVISNDINELERVNMELETLGDIWSLSTKNLFELNLVLEEMITNIIFYAYDDELQHEIVIFFKKTDKDIAIQLIDDGKAFDPITEIEPVDINQPMENRKIGGLGIHIAKKLMDEVSYRREGNKNILTLNKKI